MRNKSDNPPPETTQAPPASSIFDPLFWEWLTPAFGRYMTFAGGRIAGAQNKALDYINRDVHEWQLRLGFRASDGMTIRVPDAVECRELTVKAAPNWEEAVWIEPRRDEDCYAWRADLDRRTTLPAAPAAHAEAGLAPAGAPPAEPASSEPPLTEPPRSPQAKLEPRQVEPEPASSVELPPGPPPPAAPPAVDEEAAQLPALPGGAKPKPKDQQLVLDVAGELFPDGWESIPTGVIHQRVNQKLLGRNLKAVSLSTTGRALDRRRK